MPMTKALGEVSRCRRHPYVFQRQSRGLVLRLGSGGGRGGTAKVPPNLTPTEQTSQGFSSGAGMMVGPTPANTVLYYSSQTSVFRSDLN